MRNLLDRSDDLGKFSLILMWLVLFWVLSLEFSFYLTLQTRLTSFRFLHDSNRRMGTDFVSVTEGTLNSLFLCSRVSEHLPIMGILEWAEGGDWSVYWASGRCWVETCYICASINFVSNWSLLKSRVIDQTEFLFSISFI